MSIKLPDKTIEAAAQGAYAAACDMAPKSCAAWNEITDDTREYWRAVARGALANAIPHMQQAGWLVRMP